MEKEDLENEELNNDSESFEDITDFEDESGDIVIEINDDDIDIISIGEEEDIKPTENEDDIVLSKHKTEGKHSLKYDSIFKGKKEEALQEGDAETSMYFKDTFEVDKSSMYWFESLDNENYTKEKRVKERVYEVLLKFTDLNFTNNRRKPSRVDFNNYYYLLKTKLKAESFADVELFNELAVYFSDNLFNMFKLLDNKWRNMIIVELQDHIGKQSYSKEVLNRNIYEGTEVEFTSPDIEGNPIKITGVIVEVDYEKSEYKIDSYENIYVVSINDISKVLNNTKFKHNLNKLNDIDFL